MTTGQAYANVVARKLLGYREFGTMLDYMRDLATYSFSNMWERDGTFFDPWVLSADAVGNDHFKITGSVLGTDGQGHLIDLAEGAHEELQFENEAAVDYDVGLKYAVKPWESPGGSEPDGIQVNPDTGDPEYLRWEETYGDSGAPDLVTDLGGSIDLVIDGILELGHSFQGREAVVWLVDPEGVTQAIAIEHCTVTWTGSVNKITTSGILGQSTVSVNVADYRVVVLGPTLKKGFSLENSSEHIFVGTITGAGAGTPPTVFSHVGQTNHTATLANLSDVTRLEPSNDRLKIEVKAAAGESEIDQVRVVDPAGQTRFAIDEDGDVTIRQTGGIARFTIDSISGDVMIGGDLTVQGFTYQNDTVRIDSDAIITDNLEAGDDDLDTHSIKGSWIHKNAAETATYFEINGSTGKVGIGGAPSASTLKVTGTAYITGAFNVDGVAEFWNSVEAHSGLQIEGIFGVDGSVDSDFKPTPTMTRTLGNGSLYWLRTYTGTIYLDTADGNGVATTMKPTTGNAYDLGSASREWRNLYLDGTANIDTLSLSTTAGEGVGSTLVPYIDGSLNIGTDAYRFYRVTARQTFRVVDSTPSGVTPPHFQADVLWYLSTRQHASHMKVTLGASTGSLTLEKYGYFAEMLNQSSPVGQKRVAGYRSYVEQTNTAGAAITDAVGYFSQAKCADASGIVNVKHHTYEDVSVTAGIVQNQVGFYAPVMSGAGVNWGVYCENGVSSRFDTLAFDDDRTPVDNTVQGEFFAQAKADQPSYVLWGLGMRNDTAGPNRTIRINPGAFFSNGKTTRIESDIVQDVSVGGIWLDTFPGSTTDWIFVFLNDDGNVRITTWAPDPGTGYLSGDTTPEGVKNRRDYIFLGSLLWNTTGENFQEFVRFGDLVFFDVDDGTLALGNWSNSQTGSTVQEHAVSLTFDPCWVPTDRNATPKTTAVGIIMDAIHRNVTFGTGVSDPVSEIEICHGRGGAVRAGRVAVDPGSDAAIASNLHVMLERETNNFYFSHKGNNINGTGGSPARTVVFKLNGYIEPINRIGVATGGVNFV
jgi:hypothetical protein